jgi:hypothetical protein
MSLGLSRIVATLFKFTLGVFVEWLGSSAPRVGLDRIRLLTGDIFHLFSARNPIPRNIAPALIFVLIFLVSIGPAAAEGAETASTGNNAKMATRLEALADYLKESAKKEKTLASSISTAQPGQTYKILGDALKSNSTVPQLLNPELLSLEGKPPPKQPETNTEERLASAELEERAESIVDYESYLRELAGKVRTAPPERSSQMLESIYVPPQVARVLEPVLGPSTSSTPSSLLIRFFVVGRAPASVDYPAVASLLYGDRAAPDHLFSNCTGTLIAPDALLTAAHCLSAPPPHSVYFHHSGIYGIKRLVANSTVDLGVIFLTNSVTGITPAQINRSKSLANGTVGVIAGFGFHSARLGDKNSSVDEVDTMTGIKAYGTVVTSSCIGPNTGKSLICWIYKEPPVGSTIGSTCFGDSGGPLISQINGIWRIAGVTSAVPSNCQPQDDPPVSTSVDVDVSAYQSWIDTTIDPNRVAAPPRAGDHYVPSLEPFDSHVATDITGTPFDMFEDFSAMKPYRLSVSKNYSSLRVSVNATLSGKPLQIKLTEVGGVFSTSCPTDNAVVECTIPNPGKTTYVASVSGAIGQEYQVVVDAFPKQPRP